MTNSLKSQTTTSDNWRSATVPLNSDIQTAISSLEKSGLQIVLVVSDDFKLIGTITDGDIRRGFLRGMNLSSSIKEIVNSSPLVVPPELERPTVSHLMTANKVQQVPVVSHEGQLIGLHLWDTVRPLKNLTNAMVIMAGGKGTRLKPYTESCPKPMLKIGDKPILEHIVERAKADGFDNFFISVNYLGQMIEDYFGHGERHGVKIQYLREDRPLGTAGSLSLLPSDLSEPLLVTNGDVLTVAHYDELLNYHIRMGSSATMAIRPHEIQNQFGVVHIDGINIIGFEEKPVYRSYINSGMYVLNIETLELIESDTFCDMPTLFERIKVMHGNTIVFPIHEHWLDIGREVDLEYANAVVAHRHNS